MLTNADSRQFMNERTFPNLGKRNIEKVMNRNLFELMIDHEMIEEIQDDSAEDSTDLSTDKKYDDSKLMTDVPLIDLHWSLVLIEMTSITRDYLHDVNFEFSELLSDYQGRTISEMIEQTIYEVKFFVEHRKMIVEAKLG
jgi:hypothetical protein